MTSQSGPLGPRPPWWPVPPVDSSLPGIPGVSPPEPRPDWWPPYLVWPPIPKPPIEILYPPPIYTWPRLPPDHPYHLPPGYSYPNNLPPGHPGHNVPPPRPPRRRPIPQDIVDSDVGSEGDSSAMI